MTTPVTTPDPALDPPEAELPHGDEPGAHSTPDDDGEGVVTLKDRLRGGAPAANQARTEEMPPGAAQGESG